MTSHSPQSAEVVSFKSLKEQEALPPEGTIDNYLDQLNTLMADDAISDIMINRRDRVYIERNGQLQDAGFVFDSAETVNQLAQIILRLCKKEKLAEETPIIDGILPDGNRVTVVMEPVSVDGCSISIRKFPKNPFTLDGMVERGLVSAHVAMFLKTVAEARLNIIVSGNTSSGKTTLLNALSAHVGLNERIITIEDAPELQIQKNNVVRMATQDKNAKYNEKGVTARQLVKSALRMRPDRIIMGEVRGEEAFDLLQAMNTGHEGSMATIHSNNPREAFTRIEHMIMMADMHLPTRVIRQQIASAINLIIQTSRDETGKRRITHITEVVGMEGETVVAQDLFLLVKNEKGDAEYKWSQSSSRNPRIQKAIQQVLNDTNPEIAAQAAMIAARRK